MRLVFAFLALVCLSFAGPALAADWTVARADEACEARAELVVRGDSTPLVVRADGDRSVLRISARPDAEFLRLLVDGRVVSVSPQRVGDAVEAPLTPQLERALARGLTVRVVWSRGPSSRASLIGSRKALTALRDCGEQVRLARLEAAVRQTAVAETAADAAEEAAAEADAARDAAVIEARRRYQQIVLATLGASMMDSGPFTPAPRAYDFPGVGKIVCEAGLDSFDCH